MLVKAITDWETNGEYTQFGLCFYFLRVFDVEDLEYSFPEIYAKRTKVISYPWTEHYWFNDRIERINVLKEVLNDTLNIGVENLLTRDEKRK